MEKIKLTKFKKLKQYQKERVVAALFNARYPGFNSDFGVNIHVPAGYSLRIAALLSCEEQNEVVKRIFVLLDEFNTAITSLHINTVFEYIKELEKTKLFERERDDFWLITDKNWTYQAYELAHGKVHLLDYKKLIEGIEKYSKKSTKQAHHLRNLLRHYMLI